MKTSRKGRGMKKPEKKASTPIESLKHNEKRTNIPTEELRNFVSEEKKAPVMLKYPRDPSLDPQLVWTGKDDEDSEDLQVPALPIYIQEKIHPKALIEELRKHAKKSAAEPQLDLFGDFNGISFQDLVDFYAHHDGVNWSNRMILGDSLLVMASLAEKEGLRGKVQMIYIDPPYGIKFGSNWQVSTRKRDVKDGKVEDITRQPEQVKAFRDTWELGIHSYLSYLRDRLVVARDLLTETGSVFVQIGDENVHLVRCLMDEVLGSENFVSIIPFRKKTMPFGTNFIEQMADFLLWYAKRKETADGKPCAKYHSLLRPANIEGEFHHCWYELPDGTRNRMTNEQINNHSLLPRDANVYRLKSLEPSGPMESGMFEYNYEGRSYPAPKNGYGTTPDGMDRLRIARRLQVEGNRLTFIMHTDSTSMAAVTAPWFDTVGADAKRYAVQTNTEVIKRCLLMTTDPGDLVLDPTCGSGTTAFVAEQWGRRWITIDTSRVAIAIARTRLMAARYPFYILSDSLQGLMKEAELGERPAIERRSDNDVRKGFVYKRVPHVTLRSIANNPDIKEGMSRAEIEAAIAKHADTELLYDQPYEDPKRIRISGPFTVESLSPHRMLSPDSGPGKRKDPFEASGQFESIILENLKKAGVQNTVKKERLVFGRIEPHAGLYIQGIGEYKEGGNLKRAAISIGPEHGTVGPEQVKEAAKEAMKGAGFDLLIVCGFAFDPHVAEEISQYGKLTILFSRMNPDLMMGDSLLKKTGAGNLFMVFGEPDVEISPVKDGKITVKIKGLDIYDPTTGQVRSHSTDDIACWFIDTDYNEESFFVRHAYFCGADEPFEKLKKALKAEVSDSAWSSLYSTKSRPFPVPSKGKIAVKVINHYGDEVLNVYDVGEKG
jgi:adenine-specific DNA-methyltransferase